MTMADIEFDRAASWSVCVRHKGAAGMRRTKRRSRQMARSTT